MPLCLSSSTFPELFLFNPRSSQRKSKSPTKVASDRPLQTICSTPAATGKRVAYTVVLGGGLGELSYCCPPFQMSSQKPHHISTLSGQVEVCGILLSCQISHTSYPTPNLGGNGHYDQEEGNSSNLSPHITTLLPGYNQCPVLKRRAPL